MARTVLAIATATAVLAAPTLFPSAAEACISCDYVPSVVHSPSPPYEARHYKERVHTRAEERSARPTKNRAVESESVAKKVETAKDVPAKVPADNERSSIASAAGGAVTATAKVGPNGLEKENSSISPASAEAAAVDKVAAGKTAKEAAAKPVDCRKFFPSVGMTLSVPCE